jgi:tetratricopeptide (TPR) repeat protein
VTMIPSFTAEQALELGHEAVRELEALGDEQGLTEAWFLVSAGENVRASWLMAAAALEHGLEHARRAGDRRRQAEALIFLGPSLFWGPTPLSEGLPRAEALMASAGDDKWLEAWSIRSVAGFYAIQGRFDEARALLARARSILEELGRPLEAATLAFWSGPLEQLAGDFLAAEREVAAACDALEARGEKGWLSTMAGHLGDVLYDQGRIDDAAAAAARSRNAATEDDRNAQAIWRFVEAKVLARRGRFDEAEVLAREAIAIIDRSDELNNQAIFRMGLVEVLRRSERTDEAIEVLEQALVRYEQKGNLVMTDATRSLLDEMKGA